MRSGLVWSRTLSVRRLGVVAGWVLWGVYGRTFERPDWIGVGFVELTLLVRWRRCRSAFTFRGDITCSMVSLSFRVYVPWRCMVFSGLVDWSDMLLVHVVKSRLVTSCYWERWVGVWGRISYMRRGPCCPARYL